MTQNEVIDMFRTKAATLDTLPATQRDIILRLADLLAESKGRLSKENFETLVHIGAVMFKEANGKYKAGVEMAATMKKSADDWSKK